MDLSIKNKKWNFKFSFDEKCHFLDTYRLINIYNKIIFYNNSWILRKYQYQIDSGYMQSVQ